MTGQDRAERYLRDLGNAAAGLPAEHRRELLDDVCEHLRSSWDDGGSESDVRTAIDRLGSPESIVAAAYAEAGLTPAPPQRMGWRETLALIGISVGFAFFVVGWFVGVGLLWSSEKWTTRQKLIGTFVVPGGFAGLVLLGGVVGVKGGYTSGSVSSVSVRGNATHVVQQRAATSSSSGGSIWPTVLAVILVLVSIAVPIWLATRVSRNRVPALAAPMGQGPLAPLR